MAEEKEMRQGDPTGKGNREYKSDVFSMLMENPKYALDVYNALNGSNYTDPERVEMVRLQRVFAVSVVNDAAFIFDPELNLYEHQSTYCPNINLRFLIYYAETMLDWIRRNRKNPFGSTLIRIPTPHFVVFYNGREKRPEFETRRLSETFLVPTEEPELELICRIYNINFNHNEELLGRSMVLQGYAYFVESVRELAKTEDLEQAISHAIEKCIREDVLADFFKEKGNEVKRMMQLDFTWEAQIPMIRQEEREIGYAEGKDKGKIEGKIEGKLEELIRLIQTKVIRGKTLAQIAEELEDTEDAIRLVYEAVQEYGVDCPADEICDKILNVVN